MAGRLDGPDVEEGIARTVAEFDEAEALLLVEPLYSGIALRARRSRRRATGRTAVEAAAAVTATAAIAAATAAAIAPAKAARGA